MDTNNNSLSGNEGKIPVAEAAEWTANWRTYCETSGQDFKVKAFYVPIHSFKNLIDTNPNAEAVRIYLGLEDATNPASAKVVLVPVVDGHDKLYINGQGDTDNGGGVGGDPEDDSNVWDQSQPCPPICDEGNLLNP